LKRKELIRALEQRGCVLKRSRAKHDIYYNQSRLSRLNHGSQAFRDSAHPVQGDHEAARAS
jgi:hypothetical protein